jgi:hypothetical protein
MNKRTLAFMLFGCSISSPSPSPFPTVRDEDRKMNMKGSYLMRCEDPHMAFLEWERVRVRERVLT